MVVFLGFFGLALGFRFVEVDLDRLVLGLGLGFLGALGLGGAIVEVLADQGERLGLKISSPTPPCPKPLPHSLTLL